MKNSKNQPSLQYLYNRVFNRKSSTEFFALYAFLNPQRFPLAMKESPLFVKDNFPPRSLAQVAPRGNITPLLLTEEQRDRYGEWTSDFSQRIGVWNADVFPERIVDKNEFFGEDGFHFKRLHELLANRFLGTHSLIVNEPFPLSKEDPWSAFHPSLLKNIPFNTKDWLYSGEFPEELLQENSVFCFPKTISVEKESPESITVQGKTIPFPIRLKPTDGGSGKGQRVVYCSSDLKNLLDHEDYKDGVILCPQLHDFTDVSFHGMVPEEGSPVAFPPQIQLTDHHGDWCGAFSYHHSIVSPKIQSLVEKNQEKILNTLFKIFQSHGVTSVFSADALLHEEKTPVGDVNLRWGGGSPLDNIITDISEETVYLLGGLGIFGDLENRREKLEFLSRFPEIHIAGLSEGKTFTGASVVTITENRKELVCFLQKSYERAIRGSFGSIACFDLATAYLQKIPTASATVLTV